MEEMEGTSVSIRKRGLERVSSKIGFHLYEQFTPYFTLYYYTRPVSCTLFIHTVVRLLMQA